MSSTTCPKMTFFCGACRPVSAAYGEEVHLCPSSVRRGRCPHRPAGGRWRPPLRLIARAALVVCCDSPGPPPGHTARCAPPLPGPPPKPSGDGRGFGGERSRSGRSELCRLRRSEGSGACGDAVTLRALRDGQLLTAPPKIPLDCVQPVFRSAQFSVALLPGAPRFYFTPFPGKKKEG